MWRRFVTALGRGRSCDSPSPRACGQGTSVLNDLYCYFDYIGDWKFKDPFAAIALKRDVSD